MKRGLYPFIVAGGLLVVMIILTSLILFLPSEESAIIEDGVFTLEEACSSSNLILEFFTPCDNEEDLGFAVKNNGNVAVENFDFEVVESETSLLTSAAGLQRGVAQTFYLDSSDIDNVNQIIVTPKIELDGEVMECAPRSYEVTTIYSSCEIDEDEDVPSAPSGGSSPGGSSGSSGGDDPGDTPLPTCVDADVDGWIVQASGSCDASGVGNVSGYSDCNDTNNQTFVLMDFYLDEDHDFYGVGEVINTVCWGEGGVYEVPMDEMAFNNLDCNDTAPLINPNATEICDNLIDDNCDNLTDCVCGDGVCNINETCSNCAKDCGVCGTPGDGICEGNETCMTSEGDCVGHVADCDSGDVCTDTSGNGDYACRQSCFNDSGVCSAGRCIAPASVSYPPGDIECNEMECCLFDSESCGDGVCDADETCQNCIVDCLGEQAACLAGQLCSDYGEGGEKVPSCLTTCDKGNGFCFDSCFSAFPDYFPGWDTDCNFGALTCCGVFDNSTCGNEVCDPGETCENCIDDCEGITGDEGAGCTDEEVCSRYDFNGNFDPECRIECYGSSTCFSDQLSGGCEGMGYVYISDPSDPYACGYGPQMCCQVTQASTCGNDFCGSSETCSECPGDCEGEHTSDCDSEEICMNIGTPSCQYSCASGNGGCIYNQGECPQVGYLEDAQGTGDCIFEGFGDVCCIPVSGEKDTNEKVGGGKINEDMLKDDMREVRLSDAKDVFPLLSVDFVKSLFRFIFPFALI